MKGLIMEGGAMRGMFTAGVTDVFMENNIEFDAAVGVSAGATFGCNFKSRQPGRAVRYSTKYCDDYRYGSVKSWIKSGDVFDTDFCYDELPFKLDLFDNAAFKENPMDFYVVATDLETGKAVYHKCYDGLADDLLWIRASASMPLASNCVEVGGRKLLDGGIGDSIPLKFFLHKGIDKNVLILTRPKTYKKEKNKMLPLCVARYKQYPEFVKSFANRHIRYNKTLEFIKELEQRGEIFVIRPDEELNIKPLETNPKELKRVYELGRKKALQELDNIKKYLG